MQLFPPLTLNPTQICLHAYLINSRLYKSPKIPTHDLHHVNNETFNYKYELMAPSCSLQQKIFEK
jgi:hypothetical protein